MSRRGHGRISPTALFTGAMWRRFGLSPAALHPPAERCLAELLQFTAPIGRQAGLEGALHARHLAIDVLLTRAIVRQEVTQVVELAAGRSARGWRFKQRFGGALTYVETDLPPMARRKQRLLSEAGLLSAGHRVQALDATATRGPLALETVLDGLDSSAGVALISEGLLNYLPWPAVADLWQRASRALAVFPAGRYFADVYLGEDNADPLARLFVAGLGLLVGGRVGLHFASHQALVEAAHDAGWVAAVRRPAEAGVTPEIAGRPGARRVRILDAQLPAAR